jgi:hypothetical protein
MKKTLLATNPHLKDSTIRERSMTRNVESSSAVEGVWVKRDTVSGRFASIESDSSPAKPIKKTFFEENHKMLSIHT